MTDVLETALAKCDDLAVSLYMEGHKVAIEADYMPDDLRQALRDNRDELTLTLLASPLTRPDPVVFVARNLEVRAYEFALTRTTLGVWVRARSGQGQGSRLFYRLTPRVWVWLSTATDKYAAESWLSGCRDTVKLSAMREAAESLSLLGRWVHFNYRTDQISRAVRLAQPLPAITEPVCLD